MTSFAHKKDGWIGWLLLSQDYYIMNKWCPLRLSRRAQVIGRARSRYPYRFQDQKSVSNTLQYWFPNPKPTGAKSGIRKMIRKRIDVANTDTDFFVNIPIKSLFIYSISCFRVSEPTFFNIL
jgi:hypothetical protein